MAVLGHDGSLPQSYRPAVPRYFSDRRELLEILRRAVDTMFGGAAADAGKPTWCEKTPFNLLCMDFLWELVPEATIVHIKRHPVAVVASHVNQPWAPPTVNGALAWLRPVYDRWLAWKTTWKIAMTNSTAEPASSSNEHLTVSSQPWGTRRGPCRTNAL